MLPTHKRIPDVQTLLGTTAPSLYDHHPFEQFLIVGLPPDYIVHSRFHHEQQQHEPQVIYKYPPDKPYVHNISWIISHAVDLSIG